MINRQKILLIIIGLLILTNLGMLVYFLKDSEKHHHGDNTPPRPRFGETLRTAVGFNDAQVDSFLSLRENHIKNLRPLFDSMAAAKTRFYSHLTSGDTLDEATIDSLFKPIGYYQFQIDKQVFEYYSTVRTLATPEQQPKMDSLLSSVVNRMVGNRRDRQGPPPPPEK